MPLGLNVSGGARRERRLCDFLDAGRPDLRGMLFAK